MRLIDSDNLLACIREVNPYHNDLIEWGCKVIYAQPTVDAVPVIRCKDCKYYRDGDCWHEWDNDGRVYYQSIINEPNPDDYCSLAERKEGK